MLEGERFGGESNFEGDEPPGADITQLREADLPPLLVRRTNTRS